MWSWRKAGIWAPVIGAMLLGSSCSEDTSDNDATHGEQKVQEEIDPFYATVRDKPAKERREAIQMHIDEGNVSKSLYFHLGNAAYESGDAAGGARAFEKAVELDETYFKAMVNLALMYDEMQKYPKAIEVFEEASVLEPENPEVWSHLGNTYYAQRKYSKAMDLYRKSLAIESEAPHALYSMGVAFADAGMFREAVNYWSRVSKVEPESELGKSAAENVELLQKYLIP
jgi:tetratricopeptide (TPR) repeat protein